MSALSEIIEKANVERGWKKDAHEELAKFISVLRAAEKLIEIHKETDSVWGSSNFMVYEVNDEMERDECLDTLVQKIQDLKEFGKGRYS